MPYYICGSDNIALYNSYTVKDILDDATVFKKLYEELLKDEEKRKEFLRVMSDKELIKYFSEDFVMTDKNNSIDLNVLKFNNDTNKKSIERILRNHQCFKNKKEVCRAIRIFTSLHYFAEPQICYTEENLDLLKQTVANIEGTDNVCSQNIRKLYIGTAEKSDFSIIAFEGNGYSNTTVSVENTVLERIIGPTEIVYAVACGDKIVKFLPRCLSDGENVCRISRKGMMYNGTLIPEKDSITMNPCLSDGTYLYVDKDGNAQSNGFYTPDGIKDDNKYVSVSVYPDRYLWLNSKGEISGNIRVETSNKKYIDVALCSNGIALLGADRKYKIDKNTEISNTIKALAVKINRNKTWEERRIALDSNGKVYVNDGPKFEETAYDIGITEKGFFALCKDRILYFKDFDKPSWVIKNENLDENYREFSVSYNTQNKEHYFTYA